MPMRISHKNQKYAYFDLFKWDIINLKSKIIYVTDFLNHTINIIHNKNDNTFRIKVDIGLESENIILCRSEDELHCIIRDYRDKFRR